MISGVLIGLKALPKLLRHEVISAHSIASPQLKKVRNLHTRSVLYNHTQQELCNGNSALELPLYVLELNIFHTASPTLMFKPISICGTGQPGVSSIDLHKRVYYLLVDEQ